MLPWNRGSCCGIFCGSAGQEHGLVPVGIGVYGTTARLEKGYRLYGNELETEYNPVEAGLARPKVKAQDFVGKQAYLKAREEEPAATLCTLVVDDHASSSGERRYMLGREPVLTLSGDPIEDRKGRRSYVTSAGCRSLGRQAFANGLSPARCTRAWGHNSKSSILANTIRLRWPWRVARLSSTPLMRE